MRYEIVKTRKRVQNAQTIVDSTSRTDLMIRVVAEEPDGYLLTWRFGATEFDDSQQADNPLVRAVSGLLKDFSLEIEVDQEATVTGLKNWKQLQEKVASAIKAIDAELQKGGMPPQQVAQVQQQIKGLIASKESIRTFCLNEPTMFLLPVGRSYSSSEPIRYEDRLPNPFGGEPFPTVAEFSLEEVDEESGLVEIKWTQQFDTEAANRILKTTLSELAVKTGRDPQELQHLQQFDVQDEATYFIDQATGWVARMRHERTVKTGEMVLTDTMKIAPLEGE